MRNFIVTVFLLSLSLNLFGAVEFDFRDAPPQIAHDMELVSGSIINIAKYLAGIFSVLLLIAMSKALANRDFLRSCVLFFASFMSGGSVIIAQNFLN